MNHFNSDEEEEEEEGDLIYIPCKVIMFGHFQIIWKTCSFSTLKNHFLLLFLLLSVFGSRCERSDRHWLQTESDLLPHRGQTGVRSSAFVCACVWIIFCASVGFGRSMFHFLSCSLRGLVEEDKTEADGLPFRRNLCVDGRVKDLSLTVGQRRVLCSFAVIGEKKGFKNPLWDFYHMKY